MYYKKYGDMPIINPESSPYLFKPLNETSPSSSSSKRKRNKSKQSSSPPTFETDPNLLDKPEYLAQLMKDKRQLAAVPNMFIHIERLLDLGKYENYLFIKKSFFLFCF